MQGFFDAILKKEWFLTEGGEVSMATQSVTGLPRNTAAALAVVLAPTVVGTIALMLLEKDSFVRFYAVQILVTGVSMVTLQQGLLLVSSIGFLSYLSKLVGLFTIFGFIIWLMMVYRAWQGDEWELPVLGNVTKVLITKLKL
ncbi:hypothetical protein A2962_04140 [Candidatus Woesebacteria bacterium RIFCSPLOWO2_01_FULL_39_61]|uniref:DUF4870 domain-containing protein n=1 Tax=Candidatus Woesebacteria bacterium RIFCSPHIGHO2_02_FULL_39_13 TaxID=1802505 RepID=A0A1F7YXU5_9BACT|nr:MAG: hypothetical protein A2692_00495 [Candidatus Woesebacteria bacterium RIFCSPHIGHO2_01_FULL_39_95]OGM32153.1 MAG: hypothetical protein A3D01_02080 [Candidatus Woesebacteria bacterium RIFCSPHIGHO2_02_FULL_39_13]OGM36602.1 MAG: hypothetical protein A3E13_02915 [Candidatus Woesebacteria bacterium RIFCSPHIGHO2_12_FULL_40_20]OGM65943.1 MAG: hypothetical protein A2962_04140 [Candidatus Woesebacteria bacterium RIFCSPLOWO2_01_FULL_39_61]OGM71415.1 MAG: hypothetical protein A3H19_04590 [Candidatus